MKTRAYAILSINLAYVSLIMAIAITMAFAPFSSRSHRFLLHNHLDPAIARANASMTRLTAQSMTHTKNVCDKSKSKTCNILKPLIVCGPSGAGKGTIIEKFMKEYGGSQDFGFTVSHTTRNPREGEIDGVHYHFTEYNAMKAAISRGEFLEYAEVHGNLYGTSLKSLKDMKGKLPILDIDVQGVKNVKAHVEKNPSVLQPKYIFISPPSMDILRSRLESRGTETLETLERRTKNALAEMEYGNNEGNFDKIVINDDLNEACTDFTNAVTELYNE